MLRYVAGGAIATVGAVAWLTGVPGGSHILMFGLQIVTGYLGPTGYTPATGPPCYVMEFRPV